MHKILRWPIFQSLKITVHILIFIAIKQFTVYVYTIFILYTAAILANIDSVLKLKRFCDSPYATTLLA